MVNDENEHWFFGPVSRQKGTFIQLIFASITINIFALVSAFYILTVYDRVIPNDSIDSLIYLTAGIAVVIVFDFLMKVVRGIVTDNAGIHIDKEVSATFFDHISRNESLIGQKASGEIATTVREFDNLKEVMASATLVAFADFPFLIIFLIVLYMIGGAIAAVPAVIVLVVIAVGLAIQPIIKRMSAKASSDGKSKQSVLVEMLNGLETLKSLKGIDLLRTRWSKSVDQQGKVLLKSRFWSQLISNFAQTGQQVSQVGIIVYGVILIMNADLTMGALIACVILSGRTLAPLGQITNLIGRFNQALVAYTNLEELFSTKSRELKSKENLRHKSLESSVNLKNVTVVYPGVEKPSLENINLSINSGEKVAILGKIGSGKTTLLRAISGLVHPKSGSVQIGQIELTHLHPDDLRQAVSICLQQPLLFSGTIKDNILLGEPNATDDDIVKYAKITGVDQIASKLPDGYATNVNERGDILSGGQRQAVTIARTLIGEPEILVFDEPTSSMDTQTENLIIQNLKKWAGKKTLIVATHRGQLLELVDRVIVLESGRIVADGSKEEILKASKRAKS